MRCFVSLHVLTFAITLPTSVKCGDHTRSNERVASEDLLCNNGTVHACVCNRVLGDLDEHYLQCDLFLQVLELAVVAITIKNVNLNSHLYTGESYETYFKRRIASILSTYCEHQAHECPGTTLRLTQVPTNITETAPSIVQENVAILNVIFGPHANETTIAFAVTKARNVGSLNELLVMDAHKVKTILAAQIAPLSRVLGGLHIERIAVESIRRSTTPPDLDNTRLTIILSIVGIFFAICYTVAIFKCCRDSRARRQARKRKEMLVTDTAWKHGTGDYGSCRRRTEEETQGAIPGNGILLPIGQSEPVEIRSMQRLFLCDHSQLPAEEELPPEEDEEDGDNLQNVRIDSSHARNPRERRRSDMAENDQVQWKGENGQLLDNDGRGFVLVDHVTRSATDSRFTRWSSDSDSDHGGVYRRLDEIDESQVNMGDEESRDHTESEEDEGREEEENIEKEEEDASEKAYERLRESPVSLVDDEMRIPL